MKPQLEALRGFSISAALALARAWRASLKWLSVPVNLCLAVLGLVFALSFCLWAAYDRFEEAVLWFPDGRGALKSEIREVPHTWGPEARAELIASELLLGPKSTILSPDFSPGVRVDAILLRRGRLFVDLSPEAALDEPKSVKSGLAAMERSLRASLPGLKRLVLTIGGTEPYVGGLRAEGERDAKKTGK